MRIRGNPLRPGTFAPFACLLLLLPALAGCGGDKTTDSGGSHGATVRFVLTSSTSRASEEIGGVTATYHSSEAAGDCTLVIYDIDDSKWGTESYVQFLIPNATCLGALDAGIQGYTMSGTVDASLGSVNELLARTTPFATGIYYLRTDQSVNGTFELYVDDVT